MEHNRLLEQLPTPERSEIVAGAEVVSLDLGQRLVEAGEPAGFVYFPTSGACSVFATTACGQVEIGSIGNEGMVGLSVFLDDGVGVSEVQVLVQGAALRLRAAAFQSLAARSPALRTRMARYTQAFLSLSVQSGACNALHTVEQRCARWLLMTHDRVGRERFPLSQDMLARMLGVRRPTVSISTAALRVEGIVEFRRGVVSILNREGLQRRSCECYAIVTAEFSRLLGTGSRPPEGTHGSATAA